MVRLFISILLTVFFSGCASTPPRYSSDIKEEGMPIHGRFCGPGVPPLRGKDKDDILNELEQIDSHDLVDQACKQHDICYTLNGYFDRGCDRELRKNLERVSKNFSEGSNCQIMINYMLEYFRISNVGWVTEEVLFEEDHNFIESVILLPFALIGDFVSMIKTFGVAAVDTSMVAISRDFLPDRYEICGTKSPLNGSSL